MVITEQSLRKRLEHAKPETLGQCAKEVQCLLGVIDGLREEVQHAQKNNHQRNVELDALHYVWCDGGCDSGVHRWCHKEGPLTEEIVSAAERNTKRMRRWLLNYRLKHGTMPRK